MLVGGFVLVIVAVTSLVRPVDHAVEEIALPLRHEDIIRQQAADKRVDASLDHPDYTSFTSVDQRGAGPRADAADAETADYNARKTGWHALRARRPRDAADQIAYGTWYLRYLLSKYDGNTVLALAAYNAGETKVDKGGGGRAPR